MDTRNLQINHYDLALAQTRFQQTYQFNIDKLQRAFDTFTGQGVL
jgi:hypothetical protein